jgi:hypothetical protein
VGTGCYRQGDVLLQQVAAAPSVANEVAPRRHGDELAHVLAAGEESGHAHRVPAEPGTRLLQDRDEAWLELVAPARLLHEEHAPIDLPAGTYRVVRQRRYDPRRAGWRHGGD